MAPLKELPETVQSRQSSESHRQDGQQRRNLELSREQTTQPTSNRPASLTATVSRVPTASKPPTFSLIHEILFIAIISSSQLLTQAGLAQSIAPLHVIGETFNVTHPGQLSWLPAGYSLTVGTFILPAGRWGDLYGHRKLFIIGYFWFALWTLIAGFSVYSHSLVFFAFCRGMQGLGPALLLPNGIAILSRIYPPGPRKAMVLSIFGATAPGGFVIGAVFAGIFTQFVWWPWSYWVLAIVLALLGVAVIFVVPNMPVAGGRPKLAELDIPGTVIGVSGLILFNFAWNQGPAAGWQTVYVYVLLIVGVAAISLFFWYEKRWARYPLVPMSSFNRDTRLVFGCEALAWASFGIWVFYLWYRKTIPPPLLPLCDPNLPCQAISGDIETSVDLAERRPGGPNGHFWMYCRHRHGTDHRQDPARVHHAHQFDGIHDGDHSSGHHADPPDLLGSDVCLVCRHLLGDGYVVPLRCDHPVQPDAAGASRPGSIFDQHGRQL